MPVLRRTGRTPPGRPFLLAGFGSLLLLLLVAGGYALRILDQVRTNDLDERNNYLRRDHALDRVRTGIYQSAIIMRDYLLASGNKSLDEKSGAAQIERFAETRSQTDRALAECTTLIDPTESEALRQLNSELQVYWRLLEYISQIPAENRLLRGSEYLSNQVRQHRAELIQMVDQVDAISARQLAASDARMNETFDRLRRRLALIVGLAVCMGLLLAAFTAWRTLRLERELEQRYGQVLNTQKELTDLSARLVSAQEEERRSISRELHDEVGQSLSALLMEAGNAAAHVAPDDAHVRQHVDSIKKLAEASVNIIRNMTLLLRPSMLDDFGLVPALEWQARGDFQTHWNPRARGGCRYRRRVARRSEDLHLSRGPGSLAQLRPPRSSAHGAGGGAPGGVQDRSFGGRRRPGLRRPPRTRPGTGGNGGAGPSPGRRLPCSFHSRSRDQGRCGVTPCELKQT